MNRYVAAFERYDVAALTALMHEDAILNMPPYTLWLRGHESIAAWMRGPGCGCEGSRLVAIEVCGSPGFAQWRPAPEGGHRAWAINVLELSGAGVARITSFLDTETLFPRFGLPVELPAGAAAPAGAHFG